MYKSLRSLINYVLSLLVNLVMRSDIKEDNLVFKLDVDNTDVTCYGECTPALQVTGQRMIVDRCITIPSDKHIHAFIILLVKFFILCDALRVTFNKRMVELNALHVGGIPSCF
jgi:hypothetical protein